MYKRYGIFSMDFIKKCICVYTRIDGRHLYLYGCRYCGYKPKSLHFGGYIYLNTIEINGTSISSPSVVSVAAIKSKRLFSWKRDFSNCLYHLESF